MLLTQAATPEPSAQTLHRSLGPASGCCVLYDEEKTAPSSLQASVRVDVGSEQWAQQQIQLLTVLSLQRVGTVHHQTQWHDVIFTVPGTGGAAPTMNKLCAIVPFLLFNRAPQNAGAHPALCTAAGQTNEICTKDLLEVLPSPPDTDGAQEASAASLWPESILCESEERAAYAEQRLLFTAGKPEPENPTRNQLSDMKILIKATSTVSRLNANSKTAEHFSSSLDTDLRHRSSFQSFCRILKDNIYAF